MGTLREIKAELDRPNVWAVVARILKNIQLLLKKKGDGK